MSLVLSLFPGIGILDQGFEEAGFCVVRGPDLLWGGDIRLFHPPPGVFDGIIGGPPCQCFSRLANLTRAQGHVTKWGNLIPEFVRVVEEAAPTWFVMENVEGCPTPTIDRYGISTNKLNNRWLGGTQSRLHLFFFGMRNSEPRRLHYRIEALEATAWERRVLASDGKRGAIPVSRPQAERETRAAVAKRKGIHPSRLITYNAQPRTIAEALTLQGLPADFLDHAPFTKQGKFGVVGNAVSLPMAHELARAVREALSAKEATA